MDNKDKDVSIQIHLSNYMNFCEASLAWKYVHFRIQVSMCGIRLGSIKKRRCG